MFLGRVVRPGVDPEWTDDDQDKAIAFIREQAKVCSSCGTRRDLWLKSTHEEPPYIGQLDHCPGCEALSQEKKNVREGTEEFVRPHLVLAEHAVPPDEEPPDGPIS